MRLDYLTTQWSRNRYISIPCRCINPFVAYTFPVTTAHVLFESSLKKLWTDEGKTEILWPDATCLAMSLEAELFHMSWTILALYRRLDCSIWSPMSSLFQGILKLFGCPGKDAATRRRIQASWTDGSTQVICATIAFGKTAFFQYKCRGC